jgi:hypothetical protein
MTYELSIVKQIQLMHSGYGERIVLFAQNLTAQYIEMKVFIIPSSINSSTISK